MHDHDTPAETGLCVGATREPALLVAGVTWSLLRRGHAKKKGDRGLFSHTPGTPLRALVDDTHELHHEELSPMSGLFPSIVIGKGMFGYLPRV